MIEKLVLGGTWTGDFPIFSPNALPSAPSRQDNNKWKREISKITGLKVVNECLRIKNNWTFNKPQYMLNIRSDRDGQYIF